MNVYFIYRPATREYVQFFDGGSFGPHIAWTTDRDKAYPFGAKKKAHDAAEEISRADKLITQVITFRELGRSTIDWTEQREGEAS